MSSPAAIFDDQSPSSNSSPIPPAMLGSPCAVRVSFRMPFFSQELTPVEDLRFTRWEDKMHYDHTGHSLELHTYRGSNFVIHALMRSCSDGKLVEFSGHCHHGDCPRFCNCTKDFTFRNAFLDTRRVMFKKFHDERVERFVKPYVGTWDKDEEEEAERRFNDKLRAIAEAAKRKASLKTSS